MEKRRAHYDLKAIQTQMNCIEVMNLTVSARHGIKTAGMSIGDVLEVVQGLGRNNFYKSMTTYFDNRIWQDVYHAEWKNKFLYVKFQRLGEYFVVSFKEL